MCPWSKDGAHPIVFSLYRDLVAAPILFLAAHYIDCGRGLHSSTFQLNLSALYGIRGERRGYVARVNGV